MIKKIGQLFRLLSCVVRRQASEIFLDKKKGVPYHDFYLSCIVRRQEAEIFLDKKKGVRYPDLYLSCIEKTGSGALPRQKRSVSYIDS